MQSKVRAPLQTKTDVMDKVVNFVLSLEAPVNLRIPISFKAAPGRSFSYRSFEMLDGTLVVVFAGKTTEPEMSLLCLTWDLPEGCINSDLVSAIKEQVTTYAESKGFERTPLPDLGIITEGRTGAEAWEVTTEGEISDGTDN